MLLDDFGYGVVKRKINKVSSFASITINKDFVGDITLSDGVNKFFATFKIYKNGVIRFNNYNTSNTIKNIDDFYIKQTMFILIKLFVHGDAHHHQKIDTVLTITNTTFNPLRISKSILSYIKRIERNVKLNNGCESKLKNENAISEAKGYLSYLKTFSFLFNSKKIKKHLELSSNIILSLESTIYSTPKVKTTFKKV